MAVKVRKTVTQQLGGLIEWWIGDKEVEVTYAENPKGTGKMVPEYDETFWLQGRRIAGKNLAMIINSDLMELNHRYTIAQIYSGLCRFVWAHYVLTLPYPDEIKNRDFRAPVPRLGRPPMVAAAAKSKTKPKLPAADK